MSKPLVCLLIDDDSEEPEIFRSALKKIETRAECLTASTGKEALNLLLTSDVQPDIIFLDMNMSPMDGHQCLQEIKKIKSSSQIPVIIYSTAPVVAQREQMLEIGATGFMRKCSSIKDLQHKLEECFSIVKQ